MQNSNQSTTRPSVRQPSLPVAPSTQPSSPSDKLVTLRTLSALKQQLYARAAVAIQQQPDKAEAIQKRVNSDAQHIAFVINLVSIKL